MNKVIKILAVVAITIFCLQVFLDNKADVDLWGNVGFVTAMPWETGFKYANTFSFTEPHNPWINHEWLSQYILHTTHKVFGNFGLLFLKGILGLCVIYMLHLSMKQTCKVGAVKFLFLLLIISVVGYGFSTRPHLFTYVLYAFFILSLRRLYLNNIKFVFLFGLLGILWVNLHGAFFIGALLLAIYFAVSIVQEKSARSPINIPLLAMALGLFIAASFINPYGANLWSFLYYSTAKFRPYLSEWAPCLSFAALSEHMDFVVLSLISFSAVNFSKKKKDPAWMWILGISFVSAVAIRRNIPLFAITAGFIVPEYLEEVAGKPVKKLFRRFSHQALVIVLVIFTILSMWSALFFNKVNPVEIEIPQNQFPVSVISFMGMNEISGNALVFFDWAEYCIWELYPRCRIFLDGRFRSAYSSNTIDDYFNFLYLNRGWGRALRNYSTDIVLIHKGSPAYQEMLSLKDWSMVYDNRIAALFLKKEKHTEFFKALKRKKIRYPEFKKHKYFP